MNAQVTNRLIFGILNLGEDDTVFISDVVLSLLEKVDSNCLELKECKVLVSDIEAKTNDIFTDKIDDICKYLATANVDLKDPTNSNSNKEILPLFEYIEHKNGIVKAKFHKSLSSDLLPKLVIHSLMQAVINGEAIRDTDFL